jgi:hypothetical protein
MWSNVVAYVKCKQPLIIYRFKVFGEHTFIKLSFDDIKNDRNLLYNIHPNDLIQITIDNYINRQQKSTLKIAEILRDNKYKIFDSEIEEIISGDDICDNIAILNKMNNIDLYKVAYNTGFIHGKSVARKIIKNSNYDTKNKVISLQVIHGNRDQ